jgi:hypothetical protein
MQVAEMEPGAPRAHRFFSVARSYRKLKSLRIAQLSLEPADKSKYFKATVGSIAARRIEEQP